MKKYVPFYESTKLQEKWIKQFQQLNKYDQATLRRVLEKYSVDIENTNFKVFDPLDFDSRAPEWKNPNTKIIFLYQTKDYRTNQPGEIIESGDVLAEQRFVMLFRRRAHRAVDEFTILKHHQCRAA